MNVMDEKTLETEAPDPVDQHVGRRIWQRRREVGLSRRALGEIIGIGLKQINKYETAVNRVSAGRLYEIAAALGVPPTYFFEGFDEDSAPDGNAEETHSPGGQKEVRALVDAYHKVSPDVRSRFLRLVRVIADSE